MKQASLLDPMLPAVAARIACVVSLLGSCAASLCAMDSPSYFPLEVGNQWVLESAADPSGILKIEVLRTRVWNGRSYYLVAGYASRPMWLRYAGDSRLVASELPAGSETPLATLSGEPAEYTTTLGGCAQTARTSTSPIESASPSNILPLQIDYVPCPGGGLVQEVYRSGLGLVQRTVWTSTGPVNYRIAYALVRGRVLGLRNRTLVFHSNFRNSAESWLSGFASYSLDGPSPLASAELRYLPAESVDERQAMYLQSVNQAAEMFMFVKRLFSIHDGLEPDRSYRLTVDVRLVSNAPGGCGGVGENVYLKAGAASFEPVAVLGFDQTLQLNIDKGSPGSSGLDSGVLGTIANGQPCVPEYARVWRPVQHSYSHPVPLRTNSRGELWLWTGTDSSYLGLTSIFLESITFRLTPEL